MIHCMNRVAPLLALSALPHCLMLGYEGVIIAGRDVTFLSFNYVIMALFFLVYQVSLTSPMSQRHVLSCVSCDVSRMSGGLV